MLGGWRAQATEKLGDDKDSKLAIKLAGQMSESEFVNLILQGEMPPTGLSDEESALLFGGGRGRLGFKTSAKWIEVDWSR